MNFAHRKPSESELHDRVLSAITGALREENEPRIKRLSKVLGATVSVSVLCGLPFWVSFRSEMDWVWHAAVALWVVYFFIGFTLYFKPQPRLMVSGLFSPYVISKLFLISTIATIAQILICPSFVFLTSSFGWNPLLGLTEKLMNIGGMSLCMGFCGFLFSSISAGVGIRSIHQAAKARSVRSNVKSSAILLLILLASQVPVLFVQIFSEDLRPFAGYWILGILFGFTAVLGAKWGWSTLRAPSGEGA